MSNLDDLMKQREELDRLIEEEKNRVYPPEVISELEDMRKQMEELSEQVARLRRYRREHPGWIPYPSPGRSPWEVPMYPPYQPYEPIWI